RENEGLSKADAELRDFHALHIVDAIVEDAEAGADNGFAGAKEATLYAVGVGWAPSYRHAWGDVSVVGVPDRRATGVANGQVADGRVENLAGLRSGELVLNVAVGGEDLIGSGIHFEGLLPFAFAGRRLPTVAEAESDSKVGTNSPGILHIHVV